MMKTLFTILAILFLLPVFGQDTTLPSGMCRIYLQSGRVVKDARLWTLNKNRLEYLKDENLHDVQADDIKLISCGRRDFILSDTAGLQEVAYDLIALYSGDTISCFISEINQQYISFRDKEGQTGGVATWETILKYKLGTTQDGWLNYQATFGSSRWAEQQKDNTSTAKNTSVPIPVDGKVNYYKIGKADGRAEYRGGGSMAGGIICGVIPVFGWITMPITLAVPPNTHPQKTELYRTNREYARGYNTGAHMKKIGKTIGGFCISGALLLLLML